MEAKWTDGNDAVDEKICPLCGGDNQCGADQMKGTCWCVPRFSEKNRGTCILRI